MKLTLAEHIKRSRDAVAANKAKGNKHAELFATMYTQPSRFIEEILQNTEDAYTRKNTVETDRPVRFKLFADKIEIHHNGEDFDENDLMSITTFANTTKKNNSEVNLIGKFGIGFKSVFSITDFPEIHCGKYHYKITDFEVLTACEPISAEPGFNTLIVLPFKRKSIEECYASVRQGLNELNAFHLLFLKKLSRIEIFEANNPFCTIEKDNLRLKKNIEKRTIRKNNFITHSDSTETYLVHSIQGKNKKLAPELAFKVEENNRTFTFISVKDAPLFVYFPLKMYSGQNFLIHAPFTTNPLRDYALFDSENCPENIQLLDDLVHSFISVLTDFMKIGFYSVDFLSKVFKKPEKDSTDRQKPIIQEKFFNALKDYLISDENIPVGRNKFAKIENAAIPEDEDIYGLLGETDLKKLFQRQNFIDPAISSEDMTDLRKFLINDLNVKIVDAESFAFRLKVASDFLEGKSVKWLKEFYRYLHTKQKLWDIQHAGQYYSLRHSPIILTSKNIFEAAYDNESKAKIFLPGGKRDLLPVVHPNLFSDVFCSAFFNDLELKVPDTFSGVVYNILPQFEGMEMIHQGNYYKNLDKIILAYSESSQKEREILIEILKKTPWVQSYDESGRKFLSVPSETYIRNDSLVQYFKSCSDILFLDSAIYSRLLRKHSGIAISFIHDVGITDLPRIFYSDTDEPIIDGFDCFLKNINTEKSKAFAKILINANENYFDESVLHFLRKRPWVYTKSGRLAAPETISFAELAGIYRFNQEEKFKFQILMAINSANQNKNYHNIPWQPLVKPEKINLSTVFDHNTPQLKFEGDLNLFNALQSGLSFFEPNEITLKKYSPEDLINIHNWSRDFLLLYLNHQFPDPEYSVKQSDISDIIVVKNEEIIEYVFICSKTDLMPNFYFPIGQLSKIYNVHQVQKKTLMYCVDGVGNINVFVKCLLNPAEMFINDEIQFTGNLFLKLR